CSPPCRRIRLGRATYFTLHAVRRLEGFDPSTWPQCEAPKCSGGRVFWDGYPEIVMRLRKAEVPSDSDELLSYVHCVGKCDRCGRFRIKCLTCGDMLSPQEQNADDCGHQCRCKPPWFWLASVENDEDGAQSAELHVVLASGEVLTVDRRSL